MKIIYRQVEPEDLEAVVKIESEAFNMGKKMTRLDMAGRIENYPDTFLVAEDQENKQVVGHVFGPAFAKRYIEDELYYKNHPNRKEDKYQMILSLAVAPRYRHHGIATQLLTELVQVAQDQGREALSLTCEDKLIAFYEKNGYRNEGEAQNLPGGTLYNMVKTIEK